MARALSPTQTYDITFTAVAIALQAEVPFVLIGTPGEGKTSSIKGIGESLGWPTEVVPIPGKRDPAMIQGLPRLDPETLVTKWMPFEWIKRLEEATKEGKRSLLMLDDIAEGTRDMQSYFLGVIADRILGDVELSRTSICGAANPEGDQLQVTTALANRLCHINWALTPQEFAALARSGFKTPDVPKLEERWRDLIPTSREAYAAFCETLQGFHQVNPDGKSAERLVGAFPSPRTWDMGGRLLAALDSVTELPEMKRKYVKQLLLNSAVGREAAGAFFTWAAHGDFLRPRRCSGPIAPIVPGSSSGRSRATCSSTLPRRPGVRPGESSGNTVRRGRSALPRAPPSSSITVAQKASTRAKNPMASPSSVSSLTPREHKEVPLEFTTCKSQRGGDAA